MASRFSKWIAAPDRWWEMSWLVSSNVNFSMSNASKMKPPEDCLCLHLTWGEGIVHFAELDWNTRTKCPNPSLLCVIHTKVETLEQNSTFLRNKCAWSGTAAATLQAAGTLCCEKIVNINKLFHFHWTRTQTTASYCISSKALRLIDGECIWSDVLQVWSSFWYAGSLRLRAAAERNARVCKCDMTTRISQRGKKAIHQSDLMSEVRTLCNFGRSQSL